MAGRAAGLGRGGVLPARTTHPLIHQASRRWLDAREDDEAVLAAWNALRDLLRARLSSQADGQKLVDEIGPARSARLNLTPNQTLSQQSQHEGIRHMLRGLVSYVRNPVAHDSASPFADDREDAVHVLILMSLVAGYVESAGTPANVQEAVDLLCEPDAPLDDQVIAAAVSRAGRSQFGPLINEIVNALGTMQEDERIARALLAGYDFVLSRPVEPGVYEAAAHAASRLLMRSSTTQTGLALLRLGVTSRLDPYAYAKVLGFVGVAGVGTVESPAISAFRAGEIAGSLRDEDRDRITRKQLATLKGGEPQLAAEAVEFLAAALREDEARAPTSLQSRFIEGIAKALRNQEAEIERAFRRVFPFPSMSLNLYMTEGLRKAAAEPTSGTLLPEIAAEFSSLDGWPRRRRLRAREDRPI
jgi:uncharacterized protein (TIGR02391 family)